MAIKKTELYNKLWESANSLRGGMDASQYKDYVLTLLFLKYVTDKYKDKPFNPDGFVVPTDAHYGVLLEHKSKTDLGETINIVLNKLAEANNLTGIINEVDFDDDVKLGQGKEKIQRLSKLVSIFEDLDFSKNTAEGDDILGDVYEYFMKKFATEAGKSKGQFYTPAEVSRIMAKIIGANNADSTDTTAYDPTTGSGSLLLKVAQEAPVKITLYGQEKDISVANLARMNMILHQYPDADIRQGNTLSAPAFVENGRLKTFDFAVSNPPFSLKNWMDGLNPHNDPYHRFDLGIPPAKNGDYAFFLHLLKSLKSTGKGAIILPHGVLFRGNAEAVIRKNIIKQGYIKGIIGLPANLFYGTGIPAVIIVVDKENAHARKGVFMIDASKEYRKDGPKNRLRERDIHKIVDTFLHFKEIPGYSRMVSNDEIEQNDYNLNLPRYIENIEEEAPQDIMAHLQGGIPERDIAQIPALQYFENLKNDLFKPLRPGYYDLKIPVEDLQEIISQNPEVKRFEQQVMQTFKEWNKRTVPVLEKIGPDTSVKKLLEQISEDLLRSYKDLALLDPYEIYQAFMDYWNDVMKDDVYWIVENGWTAKPQIIYSSKGKQNGWTNELLPKEIVINEFFTEDKQALEEWQEELEDLERQKENMAETYGGEDGPLDEAKNNQGKITKTTLVQLAKKWKGQKEWEEDLQVLRQYLNLLEQEAQIKKNIKAKEKELDRKLFEKYLKLSPEEVKNLVIHKKWMAHLQNAIQEEISDRLMETQTRLKALHERYQTPLPELEKEVETWNKKVKEHLQLLATPNN